jgi:hypothetical protein
VDLYPGWGVTYQETPFNSAGKRGWLDRRFSSRDLISSAPVSFCSPLSSSSIQDWRRVRSSVFGFSGGR